MKCKTTSNKKRESVVAATKREIRVIQKILVNGRTCKKKQYWELALALQEQGRLSQIREAKRIVTDLEMCCLK